MREEDFSNLHVQLHHIATVIEGYKHLEAERMVFAAQQPNCDHHFGGTERSSYKQFTQQLDSAIGIFVKDMKRLNMWDSVAIVVTSEFGRTGRFNGIGYDHGWGGLVMVLGGSVRGEVYGKWPEIIKKHLFGQGSVPTTPLEAVYQPVFEWFGANSSKMENILPNVHNFEEEDLVSMYDLFDVVSV